MDVAALARRVVEVQVAHDMVPERAGQKPVDPDRLYESLFAGLVDGTLQPEDPEDSGRHWADDRAG
ncbi:hypothetical protein F8271_31095 [Micromonospora sp. ALFpr18c]|uniref:hypothetical protein n=1 Tax=unclassified Micromonospora TaxID=2617518 RepID=UPI00124B4B87|nr:hypothetical protein [Micromonospora sp. ALFpr18c]KAB1922876.1 hypothetical protein F8271_31095 [Micromonospora sp. ALFpr18c]